MKFVKIGCPGNRPDRIMYGCVPYEYEMAKCQLTNAEWCEFLNGVEEKCEGCEKCERCEKCEGCEKGERLCEQLGLWHKDMSTGVLGGIDKLPHSQDTSPTSHTHRNTSHTFSPKPGWEKKPVVYVDYLSLCRYCNWLTSGDIERGSYDLSGDVPQRMIGAKYFLPNDAEWYKAAYFDPKTHRYWSYPTQGRANYEKGDVLAEGPPYYFADVDAYEDSPSPWGVIQMGGNAWEMLENVRCERCEKCEGCEKKCEGCERCEKCEGCEKCERCEKCENTYRGGSFGYTETGLSKMNIDSSPYGSRCYVFGARIARITSGWRPQRLPFRYGIMQQVYCALRACKRWGRKMFRQIKMKCR